MTLLLLMKPFLQLCTIIYTLIIPHISKIMHRLSFSQLFEKIHIQKKKKEKKKEENYK